MNESLRPVVVDGAYGEGGGQILRSAIAFSAITGRPVEVVNIRAKRPNPGLRSQHLLAVKLLSSLCAATVEGLKLDSSTVRFTPRRISSTNLNLDVGTAGSITLLLQTAIPAAAFSDSEVNLRIIGGTDVKWSPTVDYFADVVLPAFRIIGLDCDFKVLRRGYYPRGGGVVEVLVRRSSGFNALILTGRPVAQSVKVKSVCSRLPKSVAERQAAGAENLLKSSGRSVDSVISEVNDSDSPGTSILVSSVNEEQGLFVGGDAVGERGKPAEAVGRSAAERYLQEVSSHAPVDSHLADMLVMPLVLAEGESVYRVSRITDHLVTNLHVAETVVGRECKLHEDADGTVLVSIGKGNLK